MANILIVEDEKNMQSIIAEYMQRGGHTCFTADDGVDALMILKNNPKMCIRDRKRPIKLPRDMVLSAGMDELNFLAARLEKLDAAELMELNAALTSPQSDFHNIGQIIDYPENVDFYVHLPDVTGTGQLGDYYLNRSGMVDMPEEWKAGIFLPRFGLHIANTEHGVFTDYGYLVKSGDEWQRAHEGQPVPEQYRVCLLYTSRCV